MDPTMELPSQKPIEPLQVPPGVVVEDGVKPIVVEDGAKPIRVIVSRVYTIAVLVTSVVLLLTIRDNGTTDVVNQKKFNIGDLASQRFVLYSILVGCGCNLLQLGMLIYCMISITGKKIANNKYRIFVDYYVDKAVSLLLAATVGTGLGSLLDINQLHALKDVGSFFSISKISTALLASVLVSMSVSHSCSEEALKKYKESLEKGEAVGIFRSWATRLYNFFGMKFN